MKDDLKESRRDIEDVKGSYEQLSKKTADGCDEVTKELMMELENITEELQYSNSVQVDEHLFLKSQASQLTQDRIRIQQNMLVLENKVLETEKDIGMKEFRF